MTAPTVPTLIIAPGEGLQDSLAIAECVERNYPKGPSIFGQTASEKNLQLFFDSYVSTRLHPVIQRLVYIEMYEDQDAENAAYFKSSREKGGKTLEQLSGDQAQNLKELKDSMKLIHMALLRSGGWITGEQRTSRFDSIMLLVRILFLYMMGDTYDNIFLSFILFVV